MKRLLLASIFLSFLTSDLLSQRAEISFAGAKSASLGGVSSVIEGPEAIFNNFSNINSEDSLSIILGSQRRFELEELTSFVFGVYKPFESFGQWGLTYSRYGFSEYLEQKLSLQYGIRLSEKLSLSTHFDYNNFRISEFGSQSVFSFGLGVSGEITQDLSFGFYIFNPEKIEIESNTEIQSIFRFGLRYALSHSVTAYAEADKSVDEEMNYKLGVSYQTHPRLQLRLGYFTNPGGFSFGFDYKISENINVAMASQYDTFLGLTPSIIVVLRP